MAAGLPVEGEAADVLDGEGRETDDAADVDAPLEAGVDTDTALEAVGAADAVDEAEEGA